MLRSITLDDADGNPVTLHEETGRRQASSVSGLIGIGAPRDSRRVRPNAHGGIDETRFEDGRLIVIEGEVDDPGDVNGAIAEFRAVEAAMLETWDVAPALLKWQEGPNPPRTNMCASPTGAAGTGVWVNTGLPTFEAVTLGAGAAPAASAAMTALGITTGFHGIGDASVDRAVVDFAVVEGRTYTLSTYVYLVSNSALRVELRIDNAAAASQAGSTIGGSSLTTLGTWTRLDREVVATATETWKFRVQQNAAGATEFYFSGVLIEETDTLGAYFDGASDSAEWSGDPDASTSVLYPGKQRLVKLASEVDPPIQEAAALLSYQAQFFAEDPRAYSQVLATVSSTDLSAAAGGKIYSFAYNRTYSQSGGGLATFSNAGNRPTPPVFRIYGRCVDPQIVLVGSGRRIVLRGTVPAGSYLELDVQARTVKMDGVTSQLGFLDSENSTWMEAPRGVSQWQLISTDFDSGARLDVLGRSAYA